MRTFSALTIVLGLIVLVVKFVADFGASAVAGWIFIIGTIALSGWFFGRDQAEQSPYRPQEAPPPTESQKVAPAVHAPQTLKRPTEESRYGSVKNK